MLLSLATPVVAATCRYTEQDLPDTTGPNGYIDVLDDSHMNRNGDGVCDYFMDDAGGHLNCPGQAEQFFSFAGKSPHDHDIAMIIYGGVAWYRDPRCRAQH